jgi:serine/threonine-protein kinase SRPK3
MAHSCAHVIIHPSRVIEEETVSGYKAEHYYPVRIGDVFQDRYRVICKTGCGSASTVWLCRDLHNDKKKYVALEIYINRSKVHRELPIYTHISGIKSDHYGQKYLRKFLDSFEINSPNGKHICLVNQALSMTMEDYRCLLPNRGIDAAVIRETFGDMLRALDFLREEAHVIHTGLL